MGKHWKYFFLLLWISYLLVSGVLLFVRGFLLHRVSLTHKSTCKISNNTCTVGDKPALSNHSDINDGDVPAHCFSSFDSDEETNICVASRAKVILFIIDALRYDFVYFNRSLDDSQVLPYQNKLAVINELLTHQPNHSKLYKFIADPPTTTMQRLKGITTGSLPTFVDIGSNFATPEINEDNVLDQLRSQNQNIVFLGDDTWTGLFPNRFLRQFAYPSFNVWDLDTVDNGIKKHIINEIQKSDWSFLIAHFLGVDHCGHRYGPQHVEMSRKLQEMNDVIRNVVNTMDDSTMLFVIGDHGMTSHGDHGGDSEDEVSAAMFVHSHKPLVTGDFIPHREVVKQIDLVPTLSTILGLPIPFSNLGSVILDALPSGEDISDQQYVLKALKHNLEQVTSYIHRYSSNKNEFSQEKLTLLKTNFNKLQDQVQNIFDSVKLKYFAVNALEYLMFLRKMCEEVWVEFDPMLMSRGLVITFVTIFFSFLIVDRLPGEVLNTTFLLVGYISMLIAVVVCIVSYNLDLVLNLEQGIYFFTGIVSLFLMSILIIQNWEPIVTTWHNQIKINDWTHVFCRMLVALSLVVMFSNSYVVEEATVLSYLFLSLLWLFVFNLKVSKKETNSRFRSDKSLFGSLNLHLTSSRLKVICLVIGLSFLLRLSHYYWRCREEQSGCESFVTHKPHSSGTLIEGKYRNAECLSTLVFLGMFVSFARIWLRSCGNLVGFSPNIALSRYSPSVIVVCTGGFWILHSLPRDMRLKFFLPWQLQFLPWVIYFVTATAVVIFFIQPLCIYIIPKQKDNLISVYGQENAIPQLFHQVKDMMAKRNKFNKPGKENVGSGDKQFPVIYGLATVYSALFVNLSVFLCLFIALLLGDVLAPSVLLMVTICIGLLVILAVLQCEKSVLTAQLFAVPWSFVVCWGLLSIYFFYGTGHQPTFPSIQWDAAFVGTGGQFSNHIIPALLIGFNTFSSQIIMGLMLPLVLIAPFTLWVMFPKFITANTDIKLEDMRRGEMLLFEKDGLFYRGMFTLCTKYILFHGMRMFACMFAATIHCRHLMVWKIFAPKLIFEGLGLFVTIPSVLVAYLITIRITSELENLLSRLDKVQR
ncbi:GPI ethanolamine phosphate transferase 3 [Gryllus bimaculatus]|nr:GPI ethanolamine phosphate transferase 3 [Gryllus bimaculatus]